MHKVTLNQECILGLNPKYETPKKGRGGGGLCTLFHFFFYYKPSLVPHGGGGGGERACSPQITKVSLPNVIGCTLQAIERSTCISEHWCLISRKSVSEHTIDHGMHGRTMEVDVGLDRLWFKL